MSSCGSEPLETPIPRQPQAGEEVTWTVDEGAAGVRLDVFLAREFPGQSRSFLARSIDKGAVRVDGEIGRAHV